MRRILFASTLAALALAALPQAAQANPGSPLCLPGAYSAVECVEIGPSAYLNRMEQMGITFPLLPLPAVPLDPEFADLKISYATVTTMDAGVVIPRPLFASAEDAAANTNPSGYMKPGSSPHYVSYSSVQTINGANYYLTENGWMRRGDLSPAEVRRFTMGVEFKSTPTGPFGWVMQYADGETAPFNPRTSPGMDAPRSPNVVDAYGVLKVYDIQEQGELSWYMVGPDMWLNSLQMRLVFPATQPPEGVDNGRWIEINLEQQSISVYEDNQLVFATLIASGLDNLWTRPGLFQVYEMHEKTSMSGDFSGGEGGYYFLADVPWTIYYDQARAIHGAYWRPKQFFGFQGSHGCVNLSVGDAHWFFNWTNIGDWVYVHDPSGRTPTDDEFTYGAGAP